MTKMPAEVLTTACFPVISSRVSVVRKGAWVAGAAARRGWAEGVKSATSRSAVVRGMGDYTGRVDNRHRVASGFSRTTVGPAEAGHYGTSCSIGPQGDHRIDPHRAPGRHPAGCQADQREQCRSERENG